MSEIVKAHVPCEFCGSSDGATIYTDHKYCFVCEKHTWLDELQAERGERSMSSNKDVIPGSDMEVRALKARGITSATCQKYGYYISKDDYGNTIQVADYKNENGKTIFQKIRGRDKKFSVRGKQENVFFGQHLFSKGRKLVITEGEIDCLTVSQIQDNKYPVVSLPFGAGSAKKVFKAQAEWLQNFEEVIVMFDMDEAGQKAVRSVSGILPPHKLKIAKLPLKEEADIVSYSFPWADGLTKMTQGIRKGEMLLLTAGTGIGKSTMAREIAYKLKVADGLKVGMVMLEENKNKTLRDLLSIACQTPLHLKWNSVDKELLKPAYDDLFGDGGFCLYDHFGSIESSNLLEKIRFLITSENCDFIIFDHVSIAISGLDESSMNERKAIDMLMTQLRSLVEETGAGIVVVSHLRKGDTKSTPFEQGGIISLDDLRGSGSLKQLPDTVLALERNQQADKENSRNVLKIRVLKCRFTGNTGLAGYLKFNKTKNILEDVDPLEIKTEGEDDKCQF